MENPRVLYIGDDIFRSKIEERLKEPIALAGNAETALRMLSQNAYSCILISPNLSPGGSYSGGRENRANSRPKASLENIASMYVLRQIIADGSKNRETQVLIATSLESRENPVKRLLKAAKDFGNVSYFNVASGYEVLAESIRSYLPKPR